jgi:hypothetical protein
VFHRLGFSGLESADTGHVNVSGLEQTSRHVAINGLFADLELIRVVDDDVMNRLTASDQGADKFIQNKQFTLGDVRADPRFNEQFAVCFMSFLIDVVFLAEYALKLIQAAVANIRGLKELVANLFFEVGANFVAQIAGRAFASALGFIFAKIVFVAVCPFYATVADAIPRTFVADNGVCADFP